jgi:hypothetical protein
MQFCSNVLPVRCALRYSCNSLPRLHRRHAAKRLRRRPRAQTKAEPTAGQTGSMATFINGKLSTQPLKARAACRTHTRTPFATFRYAFAFCHHRLC